MQMLEYVGSEKHLKWCKCCKRNYRKLHLCQQRWNTYEKRHLKMMKIEISFYSKTVIIKLSQLKDNNFTKLLSTQILLRDTVS